MHLSVTQSAQHVWRVESTFEKRRGSRHMISVLQITFHWFPPPSLSLHRRRGRSSLLLPPCCKARWRSVPLPRRQPHLPRSPLASAHPVPHLPLAAGYRPRSHSDKALKIVERWTARPWSQKVLVIHDLAMKFIFPAVILVGGNNSRKLKYYTWMLERRCHSLALQAGIWQRREEVRWCAST